MKQLSKILCIAIFAVAGIKLEARTLVTTSLTSESNPSENFEIIFKQAKVTFVQSISVPCHFAEPCPAPQISKRDVQLKIDRDETPLDGPKVISLGDGYSLHISYDWVNSQKKYLLFLPQVGREESQRFVKMNVDLDIQNSK